MKPFLPRICDSVFLRNVALVASGSIGAQAIIMAIYPILTRLYGPFAIGLVGVFIALLEILSPVASLTYPIAIVLPEDDNEAKNIAKLSVYTAFLVSTLVTSIILIVGDYLLEIIGVRDFSIFMLLIPLAMFFAALAQILQQWLVRKKQFNITAKAEVAQALIINSAKAGMGWIYPMASALIILSSISNAILTVLLAYGVKNFQPKLPFIPIANKKRKFSLWGLAKKYYDFPLYRAPQVLINAISHNLPIVLLAAFFGPVAAGFFAISRRVLCMPSVLIGKSVGNVFYPRITEAAHNGENLTNLIIKATLWLSIAGFVPFVLIAIFGPWIFGMIFGSDWVVAGEYSRWLALMMFFFFINKPSVAAVPVLGLQKGLLIYEIFSTGAKLIGLYIGFVLFNDDKLVVALFGILGAISYIFLITWIIISSVLKKQRTGNA
jgi:O-antigen/teichoic acid export membrane protein